MQKGFEINNEDFVRIKEARLRETVVRIFEKMNVSHTDAVVATDVLVRSDLRGIESHGVSTMLRKYIRDYKNGKLNPDPQWKIARETPSTASIDADRGLGIIIAPQAMELAIQKAKAVGIGMVTMKNVGHMGMSAYYPMMALPHNMIGVALTSTPPEVFPTFGAEPRLGTNPIALAAPGNKKGNFVFDAATSVVSNNKLSIARRLGATLPSGWIAEIDGTPAMREIEPPLDGRGNARLLPLGSTPDLGSHKGYGLGCVVDILAGILSGAGYGAMVGRGDYAHTVVAYDIEAFMDAHEFKNTMDEWLQVLNDTKPAPGHDRVYYPGEREDLCEKEYQRVGIPLHTETVEWFRTFCKENDIICSL